MNEPVGNGELGMKPRRETAAWWPEAVDSRKEGGGGGAGGRRSSSSSSSRAKEAEADGDRDKEEEEEEEEEGRQHNNSECRSVFGQLRGSRSCVCEWVSG